MSTIVIANGIRYQIEIDDKDKDGVIDTNIIKRDFGNQGETSIVQPTELGEVINRAFPDDNTDSIKMLGNLHPDDRQEVFRILAFEKLKMLPKEVLDMVLDMVRLTVSDDGRGRDDMVNISSGNAEREAKKSGVMEKLNNAFGMRK